MPFGGMGFFEDSHQVNTETYVDTKKCVKSSAETEQLHNLATFVTDVVLIAALYVVLKPVNRNLALLRSGD